MEDDMNKDYKKPLIIIVLIAIVVLLIIYLIGANKSNTSYLILDSEIIKYEDGVYNEVLFEDAKDKEFRIIVQNNYLGKYYSDHYDYESNYVFFRLDDKSYVFSMPLLALQDGVNYIEFEKEFFDQEDLDLLNSLYNGNKLENVNDFTEASKVTLDLDNNGIDDTIYSVICELDDEYIYSTIFVDLNGNIQILDEDQGYDDDGRVINTSFSLQYIIDIDDDDVYELIFSKASNDVEQYSIYTLKDEYVESYYTDIGGE